MSVSNTCAVAEGWRDRKVCDREDDDTWWAMILIDTRDTDTTPQSQKKADHAGISEHINSQYTVDCALE